MNCYNKLFEALTYGPRTSTELRDIVGAGFAARISEWNKVWRNVKIIRESKLYRLSAVKPIKIDHKRAYPDYYPNGKYEWPAKQRENAA
jgi:hypothetical protein